MVGTLESRSNIDTDSWPRNSRWLNPNQSNRIQNSEFGKFFGAIVLGEILLYGGHYILSMTSSRFVGVWFVGFALMVFLLLVARSDLLRRSFEHPSFLPEAATEGQEFLIDLVIHVDGRATGQDRGIVGLGNDGFFFAGAACSFALAAKDFEFDSFQLLETRLKIGHPFRRVAISLQPVSLPQVPPRETELRSALKTFIRKAEAAPELRSFPPLEPPIL